MDDYTLSQKLLLACRKVYRKIGRGKKTLPDCEKNAQKASDIIFELLNSGKPAMISRFGSTEYYTLINYLSIKKGKQSAIGFIKDEIPDWWWNKNLKQQMQNWSGFFPPTEQKLTQFCELMLEDMKQIDILGSWLPEETIVQDRTESVSKIQLPLLEPYHASNPWSRYLKDKKVLVVHPFAELIEQQYLNRKNLFNNLNVLPEFDLKTITAVQSLGGESNNFKDWFEALQWMKDEIDNTEYDVCLIGAGAYGFSLAAHVKRTGKQSIHLGGALQLLFGIRGKRWELENYPAKWGLSNGSYTSLMNKYWVKPGQKLKPKNADTIEGSCYW